MLAGIITLGVLAKTPHISLKIDELQDETQSLLQGRIQISRIQSETSSTYANADDGAVTLSFHLSSIDGVIPADEGVMITIDTGTTNITTATSRETNVTFTDFGEGSYNVAIYDEALHYTYNTVLYIGYGNNPSYIRYKNADYVGVGSIYFNPILYSQQNNCKANLTLSNIRTGFAAITCTPMN